MSDVIKIITRMIEASGTKNMSQMLESMGFSDSAGSAWKRRKKIPDGSIAKVAELTGVSFIWLKTGEGDMRPPEIETGGDHLDPELARIVMAELQGRQGKEPLQLSAADAAIVEMLHDMPEEDRKRVEYEIMTAWVACRREGK